MLRSGYLQFIWESLAMFHEIVSSVRSCCFKQIYCRYYYKLPMNKADKFHRHRNRRWSFLHRDTLAGCSLLAFWLKDWKFNTLTSLRRNSLNFKDENISPFRPQLDKCVITAIAMGNEGMRNRSLVKEWCQTDLVMVMGVSSTVSCTCRQLCHTLAPNRSCHCCQWQLCC